MLQRKLYFKPDHHEAQWRLKPEDPVIEQRLLLVELHDCLSCDALPKSEIVRGARLNPLLSKQLGLLPSEAGVDTGTSAGIG